MDSTLAMSYAAVANADSSFTNLLVDRKKTKMLSHSIACLHYRVEALKRGNLFITIKITKFLQCWSYLKFRHIDIVLHMLGEVSDLQKQQKCYMCRYY